MDRDSPYYGRTVKLVETNARDKEEDPEKFWETSHSLNDKEKEDSVSSSSAWMLTHCLVWCGQCRVLITVAMMMSDSDPFSRAWSSILLPLLLLPEVTCVACLIIFLISIN